MSAPDPALVARYAAARERVLGVIADACARSGRRPDEVTLVAVSKTVGADRLVAAVAAGLTLLGENRVQEAEAKRPLVPGARWVLVGPLQSNKARKAVETFDALQTLDSVDLAARLDRLVREVRGLAPAGPVADTDRLPVLVQVNVDRDPAKAGFAPDGLAVALESLRAFGALRLDGLMTIGRLVESETEARATFRGLRELSERLRGDGGSGGGAAGPGAHLGPALSMGMSDDYALAVEEGATIVRVGRALFGERAVAGGPTGG